MCQDRIERSSIPPVAGRRWRDPVGITGIVMWIDPIIYQSRNRDRYCFSSFHNRNSDRIFFNMKNDLNYLWSPPSISSERK